MKESIGGMSAILDEIAETIRTAKDHSARASAIAAFRKACQDNPKEPLSPAMEAANRSVTLMNAL